MQQSASSLESTTDLGTTSVADLDEDVRPSRAVVETIAATENLEQTDLPPLYDAIDPDALDTLFESKPGSADDRAPTEVQFTYFGYDVAVSATSVTISEN